MPHRIFLAEFVKVWVKILRREVKMLVQKTAQIGRTVAGVSDDFHAVAGGDDHALLDSGAGSEIAAGIGKARVRDRKSLAHFERRAPVIHANEVISHEAANLWMVEK
jgi:hypothetical protein